MLRRVWLERCQAKWRRVDRAKTRPTQEPGTGSAFARARLNPFLYLVGAFVLVALAGCGGGWLAQQREPWRHDAEVACLQSGQIKVSPAVAQLPAISGPGICGADFPLKVAALGESSVLGFADDLRPPAPIPQYAPARPAATPGYGAYPQPSGPYPQQSYPPPRPAAAPSYGAYPQSSEPYQQPSYPQPSYPQRSYPPPRSTYPAEPGAPLSLKPPGMDPDEEDEGYPPAASGYPASSSSVSRAPLPAPGAAPQPYSTREGQYDPPRAQPPDPYYTPAPRTYGTPAPYGAGRGPYASQPSQGAGTYESQPRYDSQPGYDAKPLPRLGPSAPTLASGPAAVVPAATLACPMVSALDQWISASVQPAAVRWFGQPVVEIKQISAYSCRGMNGNPHAHISEHAFGNALDIAAFTLADGRKVTVRDGWRGLPEERGFLRDVHAAACQQFSTVLGPGSNIYHYDHLHVDLMRRSSGRSICNPAAVAGDLVAGRMGTSSAGRTGEATGSIGTQRTPLGYASAPRGKSLPTAVAGED
jgi:extensin-like protein